MKAELPTLTPAPAAIPANHVVVEFGSAIGPDAQARSLMCMERFLREMGVPAEVYKATMQDDSKLRRSMTPEQRARL